MIINLYIVSHILYDCHLDECILWGFYACLKEAWTFASSRVELIAIVQPACVQILEMWQMGRYPQA